MPFKDTEDRKSYFEKYNKEYYQKNKEKMNTNTRKHNAKRRKIAVKWFEDYKSKTPCSNCGLIDHRVLEFHHPNGRKEGERCVGASKDRIARLQKEIDGTIPLCANCHRITHYEMRQNK